MRPNLAAFNSDELKARAMIIDKKYLKFQKASCAILMNTGNQEIKEIQTYYTLEKLNCQKISYRVKRPTQRRKK